MSAATTTTANTAGASTAKPPVVIIQDISCDADNDTTHRKKRAKRSSIGDRNGSSSNRLQRPRISRLDSTTLLDEMLHPLLAQDFLRNHFRKDAVCIQRHPRSESNDQLVSCICNKYLFDLDVHQLFAETSSENVFLWLSPPEDSDASPTTKTTLNSVEIGDPDVAYALHMSGSHPAYCRAPPIAEQHLVGSLLRATGLGGGQYHPPHVETVTVGGGTTLGRGEVELFIATSSAPSQTTATDSTKDIDQVSAGGSKKKHTTGWHTDFQENFTIQLSGIKRWTLRRGRVRHPLRATTPHYSRDASVVENQLKVNRLSCMSGNGDIAGSECNGSYGFEYGDNNAYGPEQTITLYPGDVFYFPSGMWHRVEMVESGVSLNVSLMGTTYASLVCEALQHLMVGQNDGWREIVTSRPGMEDGATDRLQGLLGGLSKLVDDFVTKQGGAQSLLPPVLCHPPLGQEMQGDGVLDEESVDGNNEVCDPNGEQNQSTNDETSESMNGSTEGDSEHDEIDDTLSSGIIVSMDDFKDPSGWTCSKPENGKLVKNPLASLIEMSDIAGRHHGPDQSLNGNKNVTKQYVLNVNFAGNEMMESHVRVILETSAPATIEHMDWYLKCEAQGLSPVSPQYANENAVGDCSNVAMQDTPPTCLFYYGYFSWIDTKTFNYSALLS